MLYTKPIDDITHQDILGFCDARIHENSSLDYKQELGRSVIKTIAAMANTWGGLVLIGVEDDDGAPKLPAKGVPYTVGIKETISNLIFSNISPPIFPEVKVCVSPDSKSAFVVIRVPQSNIAPHAISGNTQVYVRTDIGNHPESLVTMDRLQWLTDRRQHSEQLREELIEKAESRFNQFCKRQGYKIPHTDFTISAVPLYPVQQLKNQRDLDQSIKDNMASGYSGSHFPRHIEQERYEPHHHGIHSAIYQDKRQYVSYEEFGAYGLAYTRMDFGRSEVIKEGTEPIRKAYLFDLLRLTDLFLEFVANWYEELGYWGMIDVRFTLRKVNDVEFRDLPPLRGYMRFDDIAKSPIDGSMKFTKIIGYQDLSQNRNEILLDLFTEMALALGFSHITRDLVVKHLVEDGRIVTQESSAPVT